MLVLNCRIEFEGERSWTLTHIKNIKIERNADAIMDWCEIELSSHIKWDMKRECPLKREDKVKVYLGYGDELELAFKGYVINLYVLDTLKIFCGNEMFKVQRKDMEIGSHKSEDFTSLIKRITGERNVRIDEKISIGEFYENGTTVGSFFDNLLKRHFIRAYYIQAREDAILCCGRLENENIKAVYDIERNVIKNGLNRNRAIQEGFELTCVSVSNTNEKTQVVNYIGVPPYTKKIFRYRNLTEVELEDELKRKAFEFYFRTYSGTITVFGGRLVEKYDLIGIKENGEKRGIYEVQKNVITFGINGYRQTITIGNEKKEKV